MPTPDENHAQPRPWHHFDRRHFLVGSSAIVFARAVGGCGPGDGPSGAAVRAGDVLQKPGTPGLIDETVYASRIDEFLHFATANPISGNVVGVGARLIRAAREPDYVWNVDAVVPATFASSWDKIDNWEDTRDFDLMYMHWLLAVGQGDTPMTRLDPSVIDAIKSRVLADRYRYDDPLPDGRLDNLWFWSENHRLIGCSNEYLAGQRYPDEVFTNTGLTGTQLRARARPDILEWIHERGSFGFFEWHSNVYMLKNITPLISLVELADDAEIVNAAAMALDLCLLDMAAHLQDGCYTAPRGRTYKKDKMSSLDEDTFTTAKFVFDDTDVAYFSPNDSGATYFCAAKRYRPPQTLIDIATSDRVSVVRERHGVFFDGSSPVQTYVWAPYGRDFTKQENLPFWWSLGAVGMWPMANMGVKVGNEFRLWDTVGFEDIKLLAAINEYDPVKIRDWEQPRAAAINFGFLSEANTYAWRHPKVSLASVLDHRKGQMRDQVHAWQAAIDENAMAFTTHPMTEPDQTTDWSSDGKPGYWTGSASMPRSAQQERCAIHIYDPAWDASTDALVWLVFPYRDYTHAYLPQDHFDQVVQDGNWTVGERSGAYIALWSWRTPTWRTYDPTKYATRGMTKPFDLVANGGADNIWIVEVGTSDDNGSISDFLGALSSHDPTVAKGSDGFAMSWTSPSAGTLGFGTNGPFTVNGTEISLGGFPRHESPWGTIDHLSDEYALTSQSAHWNLNFAGMTRQVS